MRNRTKPRSGLLRIAILALGLLLLYGGYYLGHHYAGDPPGPASLRAFEPPRPLPSVELTDQYGEPFETSALRGHWTLLFLGHTESITETPAVLHLAVRIHNRLAADRALQDAVQFLMLSADPEHDTPQRLMQYLGPYPATFRGLTGDTAAIRRLAATWGADFQRTADGAIGHSTSLALADPAGRIAGLFTGIVDPATIAADIRTLKDQ